MTAGGHHGERRSVGAALSIRRWFWSGLAWIEAGVAFGFLFAVAGCGGGGTAGPSLSGIAVTPADTSAVVGTTTQFLATGSYSDGSQKDLTSQVTWRSSASAVAAFSQTSATAGVVQSLSPGTTTISASLTGLAGTTTFTVTSKTLVGIGVAPGNASIVAGASQQFTATGTYSDHTTADITTEVTWTSSTASVATVSNASGSAGLARGVLPGSSTIAAALSGVTGGAPLTVTPPPTVSIPPNNPLIDYSDYYDLTLTGTAASFSRPVIDSLGFYLVAPAARVRLQTSAPFLILHLSYSNRLMPTADWRASGIVLVDGGAYTTFNQAVIGDGAPAQSVDIPLAFFGATGSRTIEIVLPYCATVAFLGVDLERGFALAAVPARPSSTLLALGDSITQGFEAQTIENTWPYLLTDAMGWQLRNGGYGGRKVVPADAPLLAPSRYHPVAITYLIGHNDFAAQEPLATFKANYLAYINDLRAAQPSTPIYCITPLWTSDSAATYGGTIEIESYREQIREVLAGLNDPSNILVEGESLVTNSSAYFLDGIHPNDAGAAQMAAALGAIMKASKGP